MYTPSSLFARSDKADVVVYDRLVSPALIALIPEKAEKINVGKESGNHPVPQKKIEKILTDKALEGKCVVRLKGGDPFLFGRGSEEIACLNQHNIPFSEIPGISSAFAVPAYAGIPVTSRGLSDSVHIFTGHAREDGKLDIPYDALAKLHGTLIFLMGVSALERISAGLIEAGLPDSTPAAIVQNGTLPSQRSFEATLGSIPSKAREENIQAPAILIIGWVCEQAERLDWFTHLPLFGRRILLTAPQDSSSLLEDRLRELGAEVLADPCIRIETPSENSDLSHAIAHLHAYRLLIFTSKRGVDTFFETLFGLGKDCRVLSGVSIAAIAPQTATRLKEFGISADILPDCADGTHLAYRILKTVHRGDRVLLPRSAQGADTLPKLLRKGGLLVEDLPVYQTSAITDIARYRSAEFDTVIFTSASAVSAFYDRYGSESVTLQAICIGETTATQARAYGFSCSVADAPGINSLVTKICEVKKHETI